MIVCPNCGRSEGVYLTTPDYGYGHGTEFACGPCQRFVFIVRGPEAEKATGEALARSAAHAATYRKAKP